MGSVVTFPEVRRPVRELPLHAPRDGATVVILPVVRVERADGVPPGAPSETPKSPTGGKRRRRAQRT